MLQEIRHTVNTSDGIQLAAFSYGDKNNPPLILVHGYPDQHDIWQKVIPNLIDDFYVIAYDVRGAGASDHLESLESYRLSQLNDDLKAVSKQLLDDKPFHLAAHDWGSLQCWETVTDPNFAGHILSYSSMSGPSLDHAGFLLRRMAKQSPLRMAALLRHSWYVGAFHLPFIGPMFWKFYSPKKWQEYVKEVQDCSDIPFNSYVTKNGEYGIKLYRANFLPRTLNPRPRYAQCPVQAIVLTEDNYVRPTYIEEMKNWVEDLKVVEIKANHWAELSHPEQVSEYIREFALEHSERAEG
ncbi:alpha/beta fold hydrolase [uncultured Psychrobacter sp.]|uniref:alpha/beta fold hydrolase n=1 Tax=uncultured Psychrobacter sp. TaxID=259303 RepID=UPI0034589D84